MEMSVILRAMLSSWRVMAAGVHAARIFELGALQFSPEKRRGAIGGVSRVCPISITRLVEHLRGSTTITKSGGCFIFKL